MSDGAGPGFADLFAALPAAVLVVNPELRITRVNADGEELLNLSARAMIGQALDQVLRSPRDPAVRDDHGFAAFDV